MHHQYRIIVLKVGLIGGKEFNMKYWLHRISHLDYISYPLLENNYLSIGFSDFTDEKFLKKIANQDWDYFEEQFDKIWGDKPRGRYSLWNFIAEMKKGDYVLVPSWETFSVYEIEEDRPLLPSFYQIKKEFCDWNERKITHDKNGMFIINGEKDYEDIGFLRKIKPLFLEIPRYEYADSALTRRMKIRNTNADISDLQKNIKRSLDAFNKHKPINLKSNLINKSVSNWLEVIREDLSPDKFEKLIGKYLLKVGATSLEINPGKNAKDKTGDVDVIGIFEQIRTIVNIQVKFYDGETSDWAVQQIKEYAKSKHSVSDGYSRVYWVVSSSDSFSKDAEQLAIKNGVLLFDGKQFVQMLMEAGIENVDEL